MASSPMAEMEVRAASRSLGLAWKAIAVPRLLQHEEIVRAVPDGDHLVERHVLAPRQLLQEICLALGIDDGPDHPAGEDAALDLERVAPGEIDPEPLLQRLGGDGEAAGDHRGPIAQPLEHAKQGLRALGQGEVVRQLVEHLRIEPAEQCHPLAQALVVVHLPLHRPAGDRGHLLPDAVRAGQLVDHLDADEGGIHVHDDQPLAPAEQRFPLQRAVETRLAGGRRAARARAERPLRPAR